MSDALANGRAGGISPVHVAETEVSREFDHARAEAAVRELLAAIGEAHAGRRERLGARDVRRDICRSRCCHKHGR